MSGEPTVRPGQSMDWREHHFLLSRSPGGFTPVSAAEHCGDVHTVPRLLLSLLRLAEPEPGKGCRRAGGLRHRRRSRGRVMTATGAGAPWLARARERRERRAVTGQESQVIRACRMAMLGERTLRLGGERALRDVREVASDQQPEPDYSGYWRAAGSCSPGPGGRPADDRRADDHARPGRRAGACTITCGPAAGCPQIRAAPAPAAGSAAMVPVSDPGNRRPLR